MLRDDARKAVADLYGKFANPRPASGGLLEEWLSLAMEFDPEVWQQASREHIRSTKFGSPQIAEMTSWLRRVRSDLRAAQAAQNAPERIVVAQDESQWAAICERDAQRSLQWIGDQPDAEVLRLWKATTKFWRPPGVTGEGAALVASIRQSKFAVCLLHAQAVNELEGRPAGMGCLPYPGVAR